MIAHRLRAGKPLDPERVLDMREGKYSFSQAAAAAGPAAQALLSPPFVSLISHLVSCDPAVRLACLCSAPDHELFAGTVYGALVGGGQDGAKSLTSVPMPHMEELLGPGGPQKLYGAMAAVAEKVELPGVV